MKKLIKRGFAALLALTLALGMSISAFAVEGTADTKTAVAKKDYQLTNSGTTSPAEKFQFTVKKVGVTDGTKADGSPLTEADMPNLTITPVSYEQGGAGSADSKQPLVVKADKAGFPERGHLYLHGDRGAGQHRRCRLQHCGQRADAEGHGLPR